MLLSPGHSPRQLSIPSPAPSVSCDSKPNPNSAVVSASTPNVANRKCSRSVLDEDSYVAAIEKIIERDFFPDIPKLRDRLNSLQAVRTQDSVLIRDSQPEILECHEGNPENPVLMLCSTSPRSYIWNCSHEIFREGNNFVAVSPNPSSD